MEDLIDAWEKAVVIRKYIFSITRVMCPIRDYNLIICLSDISNSILTRIAKIIIDNFISGEKMLLVEIMNDVNQLQTINLSFLKNSVLQNDLDNLKKIICKL